VSDDEFARLWEMSEKQEELAKKLLASYIPLVKKILAGEHSVDDKREAAELKDALLQLMESYVPLKRSLLSLSHVQQKLKSYQVFLSHAGEQKSNYACWVEDSLIRANATVFFDEKSLKGGDDPDSNMLHAALTCQVAIIVLSPEFLQKEWPLLELLIFAVRLKNKKRAGQVHAGQPLPDDKLLDFNFTLIPDFYNREVQNWVDEIFTIPTFVGSWPTGVRLEQKLDTDHAKLVVKQVVTILEEQSVFIPNRIDLLTQFNKLYNEFGGLQTKALALAPKQGYEESQIDYFLRVARWVEGHKRTGDVVDIAFEEARRKGRELFKLALSDNTRFLRDHDTFLRNNGYSELCNVYLFTAPLDAVNWKIMKKPSLNDVMFDHWSQVAATNVVAEDIHQKFLEAHSKIQVRVREGLADPFPSDTMAALRSQLLAPKLPQSLEHVRSVLQKC
jgi:hypothetical protein